MDKKTPNAKPQGYEKEIPGSKKSSSLNKLNKPSVDEMRKSESADTISTGQPST